MKFLAVCLLVAVAFGTMAAPKHKPRFRKGLNRIVGGEEAQPGEFPHQLSFQEVLYGTSYHFCGASIISENWAICAAHCVQGENFEHPDYLRVVAGEHNFNLAEGNEQTVVLSKIIQHEDYDPDKISNDVSLLRLSEPLVFNDFVQPVALPPQGHVATGDCVVTGWGTTSEGGTIPSTLRKVTVPVVLDEVCRKDYGQEEIVDSMLCAGAESGGKDACQGDSGGPLVCSDGGSKYLAGIVSWGYGCGNPNFPGVYTEVAYFVDWITSHAV
ncbi:trypsin-1-like isoform X1 [Macrobrachium rosenbergii]|uniref:trypsin-1-like isoform X1 n=1 Tax=Macrobrachium rosenbergii TaxID=79674 RepID=UPI0034D5704A